MADELASYSSNCQLLITTHSPAFYLKSEADNAKCFYVYKDDIGKSQYEFNVSHNEINEKIGFLPLVSPYIKLEREKYLEQEKALCTEMSLIKQQYENKTNRILLLTEGKTDIKHIRFAFEQLHLDENLMKRFDYYDFTGAKTLGEELGKLLEKLAQMPKPSIVIGIFDRDKHVVPNDKGKNYKYLGAKVYRFNIPALINSERKADDKICIEHYYSNNEIEVATDFGHLYMGKDFNQYGLSNDNKYCFQNFSRNNNITSISIIDSSNDHLQKLTDDACCITKDDFSDYVISHPEEFNFDNFKKIADVILEITADDESREKAQ